MEKINFIKTYHSILLRERETKFHHCDYDTRSKFISHLINMEKANLLYERQYTDNYLRKVLVVNGTNTIGRLRKYFKDLGLLSYESNTGKGNGTSYHINKEAINEYYDENFFTAEEIEEDNFGRYFEQWQNKYSDDRLEEDSYWAPSLEELQERLKMLN